MCDVHDILGGIWLDGHCHVGEPTALSLRGAVWCQLMRTLSRGGYHCWAPQHFQQQQTPESYDDVSLCIPDCVRPKVTIGRSLLHACPFVRHRKTGPRREMDSVTVAYWTPELVWFHPDPRNSGWSKCIEQESQRKS